MSESKPPAGIVLAGGQSKRFGADKASAPFRGQAMLQWVAEALAEVCGEIVVVRAARQQLPEIQCGVPVRVVDDVFEAKGPAAGMVAGFRAAGGPACVASCDAPLLQPGLLRVLAEGLGDGDAACGSVGGRLQPLPGVYRTETCLPVFERRVHDGKLSLAGALEELRVSEIDEATLRSTDADLWSYHGANTPEDLAALEASLTGSGRNGGAGVGWPEWR